MTPNIARLTFMTLFVPACVLHVSGSAIPNKTTGNSGSGSESATGNTAGVSTAGNGSPPSSNITSGGNTTSGSGSTGSDVPPSTNPVTVTPTNPVTITTTLNTLPQLTNVVGVMRDDGIAVDFDPVDGAADYRIYPLPADGNIQQGSDGSLTITNQIYRCAGMRQNYDLPNSANGFYSKSDGQGAGTTNMGQFPQISALFDLTESNNILGYVFLSPDTHLSPVYAVAISPANAEFGWRESRPKVYTTSSSERATLIMQGGRDDGIVFYVPAAGAGTVNVYASHNGSDENNLFQYYFLGADQAQHTGDDSPPALAFPILSAPATGAVPLYATEYDSDQSHIELSPGKQRFHRAAYQGTDSVWHVEWSGISAPTTLVVEALDQGCPFQGSLSPQSEPALFTYNDDGSPHQQLFTLGELQTASKTGEVFVNGQYAANNRPTPKARSFLQVVPPARDSSAYDWYQTFDDGAPLTAVAASCSSETCEHYTTPNFDLYAHQLDSGYDASHVSHPVFTFGKFLGQLWTVFDDSGSDVTAKIRITANDHATMSANPNTYIHVTYQVDIVSTDRRYPQMLISDQLTPPIEIGPEGAFANNTVILQPRFGPDIGLELEAFTEPIVNPVVPGGHWDINSQGPEHFLIYATSGGGGPQPQPTEPTSAHAGMDRLTTFDAYVSNKNVYVFMDGTPAGCVDISKNVSFSPGPVSVTFGDTFYHEGAGDEGICACGVCDCAPFCSSSNTAGDIPTAYPFLHDHQCTETKRHWDNLGFKSGVNAPVWDSTRFPCLSNFQRPQ